jgi:predicted transcriptional regulator
MMKINTRSAAGLILLFLFFALTTALLASAENGGYIVTPFADEYLEGAIIGDGEAEATITFWDLPLWIQLSVVGGIVTSGATIVKYAPLLLGKVFVRKDNPTLQAIYSYIIDNPGCLESEITKDLGIKRGTLRYYIAKLDAQKLIFTLKCGRVKTIFQIGQSDLWGQNRLPFHLRGDTRKAIIQMITSEPGLTGKELSSKIGLDKSTVHWHLMELKNDDIIHLQKDGKFNRYYPKSSPEEPAGCKEFLIAE